MQQKFKVKIMTTGGKSYTFAWSMKNNTLNASEHPADAFFSHAYFLVKESDRGDIIVPRSAVDCVTFTPVKMRVDG